jgi:GNAT superfamily N-acetyltransferase
MTEEYTITATDEPDWDLIGGGITSFNNQHAGEEHAKRLCFLVKGADQTVLGGVIGIIYWDWLAVDLMWLPEELRGRGFGHQLLTTIEDEARRRGARHVHLDTFSFQAPEFYKKYGYRVFGELKDFPAGHTRYYMTKEL